MDLATVIGIVTGFGLIIGSILLGGSLSSYIDTPSILIVVGGTIAAGFICEKMPRVIAAIKIAKNAFKMPTSEAGESAIKLLELSQIARKDGLLALEGQEIDDPFMAKALRMAVDGMSADVIQDTLTAELIGMKQRHQRGQKFFKFLAATAPSMGMIGTLIGLVQMLQTLDDPASIGPSMAVALLTTMYGAILAFIVFGPIAEKLQRYSAEEATNMSVIIQGIESIVKGHNQMVIKELLAARLGPDERGFTEDDAA